MRTTCKGCTHRIKTSSGLDICNYILDTGKARGCPASECDKHTMQKQPSRDEWSNEAANTWKARGK